MKYDIPYYLPPKMPQSLHGYTYSGKPPHAHVVTHLRKPHDAARHPLGTAGQRHAASRPASLAAIRLGLKRIP